MKKPNLVRTAILVTFGWLLLLVLPASAQTNTGVGSPINGKVIENVRFAEQFGGGDLGAKIGAAISDLHGNSGTVVVPPGYYTLSTPVVISGPGQYVMCLGGKRTTILGVSAGFSGAVFTFAASSGTLVQTGIYGCRFDGSGNTNSKTAIVAQDVSQFFADEINVINWSSGGTSIGIQLRGREFINLDRNQLKADIPIDVERNPHSTIALDASRFQDQYIEPVGNNPGLNVGLSDATSIIEHWRIDGFDQAGGQYGVLINDPNGTSAWLDFDFRNMHWEQQAGSGGYFLNLNRRSGHINNITLNNIDAGLGGGNGGFLFRNSFFVLGAGLSYQGTSGTAINVDKSNYNFVLLNPFFQTGSIVSYAPSVAGPGSNSYLATMTPALYASAANCASTASPANCGAAPTGSVSVGGSARSIQVNTTAVTANSQIFVMEDSSLGARLGMACNTTTGRTYQVTARRPGSSFTITSSAAPMGNYACLSYWIVN